MTWNLHILPNSRMSAAENMARDFMLLERFPNPESIRLRHYRWSRPAYTFGLSQSHQYARSEIQVRNADLIRRPTGGGVVDHQHDWTYSLIIPAGHPLGTLPPVETYKSIHQCIVRALQSLGAKVALNEEAPTSTVPSVCFEKPEVYDIVLDNLSAKVAGAAQKRTKSGYLMQGSIWKPSLPNVDWTDYYNAFIDELALTAKAHKSFVSWPEWDEEFAANCLSRFESDEWNKRR